MVLDAPIVDRLMFGIQCLVEEFSMLFQIRDPVHNFIELNGKEQQVASTPIFQRLRGIRQLALASLV